MKKIKLLLIISLSLVFAILLSACSAPYHDNPGLIPFGNTYTVINEDGFVDVSEENNKSYISLTTSTAAYTDIRRQILYGNPIDKNSVKIEEMINYFSYGYALPEDGKPLSLNGTVMDTPWNNNKLLLVGMKAEEIVAQERTNNIVLLVDVSGSMSGSDRLTLAVQGLIMLVEQLSDNDIISLVTYAGNVSVLLDGISGSEKEVIKEKLLSLYAAGSTAGGSAINKAYDIAYKYMDEYDNSSIIIITDGDFNVGINNSNDLKKEISRYKNMGISLSAAGVGFGNMRNNMLESIADAGGGRHAYLSTTMDAKKFMVEEIGAILNIVAKDAKAEISFNPSVISKYRIIGYENRQLTQDEWEDDATTAGAIGSGTVVTAVYEIILSGNEGNYAELTVKYKMPNKDENKIDSLSITAVHNQGNESELTSRISYEDSMFISAVVETGLLLRNSEYKGSSSYAAVYERLSLLECTQSDKYKKDFLYLVNKLRAKNLS